MVESVAVATREIMEADPAGEWSEQKVLRALVDPMRPLAEGTHDEWIEIQRNLLVDLGPEAYFRALLDAVRHPTEIGYRLTHDVRIEVAERTDVIDGTRRGR